MRSDIVKWGMWHRSPTDQPVVIRVNDGSRWYASLTSLGRSGFSDDSQNQAASPFPGSLVDIPKWQQTSSKQVSLCCTARARKTNVEVCTDPTKIAHLHPLDLVTRRWLHGFTFNFELCSIDLHDKLPVTALTPEQSGLGAHNCEAVDSMSATGSGSEAGLEQ